MLQYTFQRMYQRQHQYPSCVLLVFVVLFDYLSVICNCKRNNWLLAEKWNVNSTDQNQLLDVISLSRLCLYRPQYTAPQIPSSHIIIQTPIIDNAIKLTAEYIVRINPGPLTLCLGSSKVPVAKSGGDMVTNNCSILCTNMFKKLCRIPVL